MDAARGRRWFKFSPAIGVASAILVAGSALAAGVSGTAGPVRNVSGRCAGQNAEVEQAADPNGRYVYEEWIGCSGIGFARSADGGRHFSRPIRLRASGENSWDPTVAVAPSGVVYTAFMDLKGTRSVPVVLASFDHGRAFPRRTTLIPRRKHNWGDRPFIAAGPNGTVYLAWDYGPSASAVKLDCFPAGSCATPAGDLNVVLQTSTNGGKTFGPMRHLSPGFPASGAAAAPLLIDPSGRIDALYQAFRVTRRKTFRLGRGHMYFTASADGGRTWSSPVRVGASAGSTTPTEWWIDGAIAGDAGGNLYATWDTQERHSDTGWLAYSTDHGATWSKPIRVLRTRRGANIVEATGGAAGTAYVGWLTHQHGRYREYFATFSLTQARLSRPIRVSNQGGDVNIWPGDTFGISTLVSGEVVLSWGSATRRTGGNSEIFTARVTPARSAP